MSPTPTDPERTSVVIFEDGEAREAVLHGFTLTGGTGTPWNWIERAGGAIYCTNGSSPTITGCVLAANAASSGGGVFAYGSSPLLKNCILTANRAESGAALLCRYSMPVLVNCTVTGNTATLFGDALSGSDDSVIWFINSILWQNAPNGTSGDVQLIHSLVNEDPGFADPAAQDFRLRDDSPAIDAGTPEDAPITDLAGNGRACGGGVDLGAYEVGTCPAPESVDLIVLVEPERAGEITPAPGRYSIHGPTVLTFTARSAPGYVFSQWEDFPSPRSPQLSPEITVNLDGMTLQTSLTAFFRKRAFLRGDANEDFGTDISDALTILGYLFLGAAVHCLSAADVNDDGHVDIADPITLLNVLFMGSGRIPPPSMACSTDPTEDDLLCESLQPQCAWTEQ
jgi:hypothetical protein